VFARPVFARRSTSKCEIDPATYPAGVKVTEAEMAAINIAPHEFHGEWNYSIAPKPTQMAP
jgi:hypothetical protein